MAPYIIAGLVTGSIWAISALGLVLTYNSSRVFNFAHGVIAYAIAVFYYYLHEQNGWPIELAAPFSILVVAPLLGLFLYFVLFRRLTHLSPTVRLVSTVGLWVTIPALVRILFPFVGQEIFEPDGLVNSPADPRFLKVFGTYVNTNQFVVIVSALVIAVGATIVLRFTPAGLATRASVDQPRNASIAGINTERVTAVSWMIGIMLAGFAGVLLAPIVSLQEFKYTLLLVGSLVAVVIGKMSSFPLTFVGAIGVGVLTELWVKYQPSEGFLSQGIAESIPFVVMLAFLIIYSFGSKGLRRESFEMDARRAGGIHGDAPPLPPSHGWRRAAGPLVLVAVLVALPAIFNDAWIATFTLGIALAIIFLSFTMVTGEGGMLSLAQATFAGIGGFAAARLAAEAGWPVWLAILAGACVAVPFGLLVALPSLRIGDLYLALLTIGFALVIEQSVWTRVEYSNFDQGLALARPFGIGLTDRLEMYAVVAVTFLVMAFLVVNLKRATSGLVFASIRSSESASLTSGISVVRAKLILFGASAFVAGFGGALYGSALGFVTPRSFAVLIGIVWLAVIVTWGVRSVIGALLAGIILVTTPQKLAAILILLVVFGAGIGLVRLVMGQHYKKPLGALAIAGLVVGAVAGSVYMWDNVSNETTVSVILVLITIAVAATLILRVQRLELSTPLRWAIMVAVAAIGVLVAIVLYPLGTELGTSAQYVPTMLFGLGAIGLAREPRGVLYDLVNRERLRRFEETERRDEELEMQTDLEGARA